MKLALIGYGKMGHLIEKIARQRGHEIVSIIDVDNSDDIEKPAFASADAVIEFSTPASAPANVMRAARAGVPVVCGSTGWASRRDEVEAAVKAADGALLASSNFSIGVYVFNRVNRYLAGLMSNLPQYSPSMVEVHHVHKLDHPSGTAITLAEGIIAGNDRVDAWSDAGMVSSPNAAGTAGIIADNAADSIADKAMPILSIREGEVPGTHVIRWNSAVDSITIEHRAKSREGFALGAVMAAEWIAGRKGIFTIDQMMDSILNSL